MMALATQCPFCQTTFRVVQDQLKLRGGLVRCGTCKEVFNGNDHLVSPDIARQLVTAPSSPDAQRAAPTAWPPLPGQARPSAPGVWPAKSEAPFVAPPQAAIPDISAAFASIAAATDDAPWGMPARDPAPVQPATPQKSDAEPAGTLPLRESLPDIGSTPSAPQPEISINTLTQTLSYPIPLTSSSSLQEPSSPQETPGAPNMPETEKTIGQESSTDFTEASAADARDEIEEEPAESEEEDDEAEDEEDAPAFVQRAERRERWQRVSRIVMVAGASVLSIALALQAVYIWRNTIVAWLPRTQPLLSSACAVLHCTVGLPTNIDQLALESSELQLVPPNQNIYALSVLLRNRSYGAQAWPYLELTLNDADEKAVVRRIFAPRDYLGPSQSIANGLPGEGEQQIKLTFELTQPAASGYRIYLFYP